MAFELLPAVDLLADRAVRLERGDFDAVVAHGGDPAALVERFARAGAPRVHVVDLDGARSGRVRPALVRELARRAAPARVQASGGIRSVKDAAALLVSGAERVVVGTAAFASREALPELVEALGERLVVALDARDGRVAVAGWLEDAGIGVDEAARRCAEAGVARILCTAIDRDGTLAGPDLELLRRVCDASGVPVLAAGGIRSEDDVEAVRAAGCAGAVVGRALLEGRVPLSLLASGPGSGAGASP